MNEAHKLSKKLNRYKRLVRRCNDLPTDSQKRERKQALELELHNAKLIK